MRYGLKARSAHAGGGWAILIAILVACSSENPASPTPRQEGVVSVAAGTSVSDSAVSAAAPLLSNRFAYVWADQPGSPIYTPNSSYAYNATGGSIQITRWGVGTYSVAFNSTTSWASGKYGFAITAYGASTSRCLMLAHHTAGTQLVVDVHCFNFLNRVNTDSYFTLLVVGNGSLLPGSAFAFGNQPSAPSYTPNPLASYTSGTAPMVINHNTLAGSYNVNLGTGNPTRSTVLVSAKSGFWNLCKVGQWHPNNVQVSCFDDTGAPNDGPYWVLQVEQGRPGRRMGFAWANRPTTPWYVPNQSYSFNSSGGAITAVRNAIGRYVITFAGLQKLPGHTENVQVTGWGLGATVCKVTGWGNSGSSIQVGVECRRLSNGSFIDSRFNVLVIE